MLFEDETTVTAAYPIFTLPWSYGVITKLPEGKGTPAPGWPTPSRSLSQPSRATYPCGPLPPAPPGVSIKANVALMRALRASAVSAGERMELWWLVGHQARGAWDFKAQHPRYGPFGNVHYGATAGAAGIPLSITKRGGGVVNVMERAEVGNFTGAVRALSGLIGLGPDGPYLGDEDLGDIQHVTRGWLWEKQCF